MSRLTRGLLVWGAVLALPASAAATFPSEYVERVSEPSGGEARDPAISQDKRFARLVAYEQEGVIYVVRRADGYGENGSPWRVGTRRRIARGYRPSLDGTSRLAPHCVAFVSDAPLVRSDTNGKPDAYLHDLSTGRTRRVSVTSRGRQSSGTVSEVQVSGTCTRVAFVSDGGDLAGRTPAGRRQVYVHFLGGSTRVEQAYRGRTMLVSASDSGRAGDADSHSIAFSHDSASRAITFASEAGNLAGDDNNGLTDVYQRTFTRSGRKLVTDTRLVSAARPGETSSQPASNANGAIVAFTRDAAGPPQVMQVELSGTTRLASRTNGGDPGNGPSSNPSLTAGGTWVVFESAASDVGVRVGRKPDANGVADIMLFTQASGERWILGEQGANRPASDPMTSPHGNYVVFERAGHVNLVYVGAK